MKFKDGIIGEGGSTEKVKKAKKNWSFFSDLKLASEPPKLLSKGKGKKKWQTIGNSLDKNKNIN